MKHPLPHRGAAARLYTPATLAVLLSCLMAAGCGSDGNDDSDEALAPDTPPPAVVRGTVAVGAALAGAQVAISDRAGVGACSAGVAATTAAGDYECTLLPTAQPPLLLVATDPAGVHPAMVGVLATLPATGASAVANITPLTTAIVGQLAPDRSALTVVDTPALIDTTRLAAITQAVVAQLADVLAALQVPAGYSPFSTPIVATTASVTGNAADKLIDVLRISSVNGAPTITTVDRTDTPQALADGSSTPATLPAPASTALDLVASLKLSATQLNRCFALPPAERVLGRDDRIAAADGGPSVTTMAAVCQDIAAPDYLHNGYTAGQAFRGLLLSEAMTGANFQVPEVMDYRDDTTAADRDIAVLNIRYQDAAGAAGNLITVARKLAGTARPSRPTDWWLHGNQSPVDSSIAASIRRNEQLAPEPGTPPFANAAASRYETGLNIFVNYKGPGSRGLRAARIKGPGLPTAGLVLTPPSDSICTSQNWLNLHRKDGNVDPQAAGPAFDTGNIFRLQRTRGLTGSEATTVRPNPNAGTSDNSNVGWAHPRDYGKPPGSTDYIDFTQLRANAGYSFELFYEGETTPRHALTRTLLTPMLPAAVGASLRWHALAAASREWLDPARTDSAAGQSTVAVGWNPAPFAERVRSIGVYSGADGRSVNQGTVSVPVAATSVSATAPTTGDACEAGERFQPLTADGRSWRIVQLRYRVLDGSFKDSSFRYN